MTRRSRFSKKEERTLLKRVFKQDAEFEHEIDFGRVKNGKTEAENHERWKHLVKLLGVGKTELPVRKKAELLMESMRVEACAAAGATNEPVDIVSYYKKHYECLLVVLLPCFKSN